MPVNKSARKGSTSSTSLEGFSDEERAAMKEAVRERRTAARRGSNVSDEDLEHEALEKIAEMPEPDRSMALRIHAIARANGLVPRTWYGMPAYTRGSDIVCHFQTAAKFKARYATLGFSDRARLDDGAMWPVAYALTELTPADEARIAELVRRAVG
jgi:hypothetical protein